MRRCRFGVAAFQFEPLPQIIRLVQEIEALGYTHAWLGDSQMIWREVFVTLGALGVTTRRITLATGVTNPVTRSLAVQASAWSSLAELTGGRVAIGMGLGDSSLETLGKRPARLSELEHAVDILRRLILGQTVELDGTSIRLTHAYGKAVPVYLAASGPRMIDLAGRLADGVILLVGTDPSLIRQAIDRLERACMHTDRGAQPIDKVLWAPFSIDEDGTKARDHVRPHVARAVLHPMPFQFAPEDQTAIEVIRRHYDYYSHLAQGAPQGGVVPDRLVEKFAIAGTPEEVLEQVRRLQSLAIDQIGLVPHGPDRVSQVRVFVEKVLSRL